MTRRAFGPLNSHSSGLVRGYPGVCLITVGLLSLTTLACEREATSKTVDFDVSEGTNLAFDISADGETIVFDLLGQLWVMPAEGGRARPITDAVRDTAEDVDPVFSPDGESIVFQADRPDGPGLWLVTPDGVEPRRITAKSFETDLNGAFLQIAMPVHVSPAWSPDGSEIVYALPGGLVRLDVATGTAREVPVRLPAGAPLRYVGSPDWSPDGERILFGTFQGGAFRLGLGRGAPRIWEVDAEGGTAVPVTPDGVRAVAPASSPDGAAIAFVAPDPAGKWQVWVQRRDDGRASKLTDNADLALRRVRWTPDGTSVIYSADGGLWRVAAMGGEPRAIPFEARVTFEREEAVLPPVRFPEPGTVQPARGFLGLALSADASQIAMAAVGQLWVWPVDGSPRAVAELPETAAHLTWSADGTEVLYTTGDLAATDVRTGATRRLTALPGREDLPAWSPDGQYIAFTHEGRLRVFRPAEGILEDVSRSIDLGPMAPGEAILPLWREDSRALLTYAQPESGPSVATLISLEGGSRALDRPPPGATFLQWPQSGLLAWAHGNRLWTAALDIDAGRIGEPAPLSDDPALYVSAAATGALLYVSHDGLRLREPDGGVRTIGWPVTFETPPAPSRLLIRNVRLIDGTGAPPATGRDVLIEHGRIARIAPAGSVAVPAGVDVLDADGRTVMPGLIDLHRHLIEDHYEATRQVAGALYHGTTTVRDAGSLMAQTAALRDLVAAGRWPGARVVAGGFIFQGREVGGGLGGPANQKVTEDAQVAGGVAIARAFGAEFVKHRGGTGNWASWARLIREAHRNGMRVSGHCSTLLPAVAAGVDGQEHTGSCFRDAGDIYEDQSRLKAEAGMWVTTNALAEPTEHPAFDPAMLDRPENAAFLVGSNAARYDYYRTLPSAALPQVRTSFGTVFAPRRAQTGRLHEAGTRLTIGTDEYFPAGSQGVLEAMVQAGLTPLEAITAATAHGARALGAEAEIGTIEEGRIADLVILDADPLEDIRNARRIWQVIQGGAVVDRAGLLETAAATPVGMTR